MPNKNGKNKYVSGFCNGHNKPKQCEGTKPVTTSGEAMPVCLDWEHCPCACHALVTSMYEMSGLTREPPEQSPEFLVKVHVNEAEHRKMLDEVYTMATRSRALSNMGDPNPHPDPERPVTVPPDAAYGPSVTPLRPVFAATPTGRRARGQLEYDVLAVCDDFMHDVYDWTECTPKLVAERIGKVNETEPPSTGAINAVWDRWEKLGFATQGKKPSRFISFEMDGSIQTLEMLKSRTKREKKMTQAELRRGIPRPRGR